MAQHDDGHCTCLPAGLQTGLDQLRADPLLLPCLAYRHGGQSHDLCIASAGDRAKENVTHKGIFGLGNQRNEFRARVPEGVDQVRLGIRIKGIQVDRPDGVPVRGFLGSYDHEAISACRESVLTH